MNQIIHGDCLEVMKTIPSGSVDMVLADLPYGTTRNKWDTPIDLDQLWYEYERVIKPNAAIVLTAAQPFASRLVMSNPKLFRYDLIWDKKMPVGFLNANRMPLRVHEHILVYYRSLPTYNPQKTAGVPYVKDRRMRERLTDNYGLFKPNIRDNPTGDRYPTSIIQSSNADQRSKIGHPTEKPVKLFEWLIQTYTDEGETVLDNCIGVGTTAIAAKNTNRNFIGIELNEEYCELARKRVA